MERLTFEQLKSLIEAEANEWESTKAEKIANLRDRQQTIWLEDSISIPEKVQETTKIEAEIKKMENGGVPTLQTVLMTRKKYIEYNGDLYELPTKTAIKRTTGSGKNLQRYTTGTRLVLKSDELVSPIYVVMESGKIMDETSNEIILPSEAVTRFIAQKEGMTSDEWRERYYVEKGRPHQGHSGFSYPAWEAV